ncbi:hypothetical protein BDV38DRAFT_295814 [Aspergillus pseudotamarii]|uniref:DUF6594 domain-containing protein n=1 Tax=Aspergillus pseudotamarii TaxID=132259 RepID=A0A5N6T761_ASPPS|nr:uncharacterized protein BDV38DRAFT_295814 [Aspergillus pseudotamarii]KAE8142049.1 hypothetical protein BDV38DRAFT_295814 [Aspergillus pseudotamarii]
MSSTLLPLHASGATQSCGVPASKLEKTPSPEPDVGHKNETIKASRQASSTTKIEDYPLGRPRYGALIASHESFQVYRQFSYLRTRLLLDKQDRLAQLEDKLRDIDQNEQHPLFLSSSRLDRNEARKAVLAEIDVALSDYDTFIERTARTIQPLAAPQERNIANLRNWIEGNPCLARHYTEYITQSRHHDDLLALCKSPDSALARVELWIKDFLKTYLAAPYKACPNSLVQCWLPKKMCSSISSDAHILIYHGRVLGQIARTAIALLLLVFLLVPVVICHSFGAGRETASLVVIIVSTVLFMCMMSWLVRAKTVDLAIVGSAYATVLTVFITGTG